MLPGPTLAFKAVIRKMLVGLEVSTGVGSVFLHFPRTSISSLVCNFPDVLPLIHTWIPPALLPILLTDSFYIADQLL